MRIVELAKVNTGESDLPVSPSYLRRFELPELYFRDNTQRLLKDDTTVIAPFSPINGMRSCYYNTPDEDDKKDQYEQLLLSHRERISGLLLI